MNKITVSLIAGLPFVAIACVATISEEDHPCPCAPGWSCCTSTQVCVASGAACPTGEGGPALSVGHDSPDPTPMSPDATSDIGDAGTEADPITTAAPPVMDAATWDADAGILIQSGYHGPIIAGDGGVCDGSPSGTLGTKVMLAVNWPGNAFTTKGAGTVSVWLLFRYAVDGSGNIAGTVQTCGLEMPASTLSQTGDIAEGVPAATTGQLQTIIPAASWDGIPTAPLYGGATGGTSIGSTFALYPFVVLMGLQPTSPFANASQPWPQSTYVGRGTSTEGGAYQPGTVLVASDLTSADGGAYQPGVGEPGIFALPLMTPSGVLPVTSLAPSSSPRVDQLWLVLRTQLSFYGSVLSCTQQAGAVAADTLDSHVVGCHLADDGGPCTTDQYGFLDANRTVYGVQASGSFQAMPMGDAGCTDVLANLP